MVFKKHQGEELRGEVSDFYYWFDYILILIDTAWTETFLKIQGYLN